MRLVLDIGKKFPDIAGPMSDAFSAELAHIARVGDFSELVLDFRDVVGINSMAMGSVFTVSQQLRDRGKTLRIVNAPEKIVRLLEMVNLGDLIAR